MRSASIEEVTHYTREQVAELLGISVNYLRLLAKDLRDVLSPEEFDYQRNDGMISTNAANKIKEYRERAKTKTRDRVLQEIRVKGL